MMKRRERPVAEWRRKFSRIWGVKTTIQQAIDMDLIISQGEVRKT